MSKGNYTVIDRAGKILGQQVYIAGKGWVYQPFTKVAPWIELR